MGQPIEEILNQFLEKVDKRLGEVDKQVENKINKKVLEFLGLKIQYISIIVFSFIAVLSVQIAGVALMYNILTSQNEKLENFTTQMKSHFMQAHSHSHKKADIAQDKTPIIVNMPDRQPNMVRPKNRFLRKRISRGIASE